VILVYGDDSADEKRQRVAAVSGLVGTEQQWRDLEMAWIARTRGIEFHAKDCESDFGDYAPRPGEDPNEVHRRNKALYRDLATMLANSSIGGLGVAIDITAQKKIFPDSLDLSYYKAFLEIVEGMKNCATHHREIAKFTFDINLETEYNAGLLFAMVRENEPSWAPFLDPEISFVQARHSPRLQAGDLLAYEAMKALDHAVGPIKRWRASWDDALYPTGRFEVRAFSEDWFNNLKRQYEDARKKLGMGEQEYLEWLKERERQHSISNLFHYINWAAKRQKTMKKKASEFDKFDSTMRALIKVPHSEIREKLNAEKRAKTKNKKRKPKKTSALGRASDAKD
jgi:hypothetical protein